MVNLDAKISVPPPAPSYSTMGKTNDAASKTDLNAVHRLRRGVKIAPWEGMDMIEGILREVSSAKTDADGGGRSEALLSSPRVSPAIVERDATHTADHLVKSFLTNTAMKMSLGHMPAARAVTPSPLDKTGTGEDASAQHSPSKKRTGAGKGKQAKAKPTAAFLAPNRPSPGAELEGRAPSVGKYTPKYGAVERGSKGAQIAVAGSSHGHQSKRRSPSPTGGRGAGLDGTTSRLDGTHTSKESDTFALTQQDASREGRTGRHSPTTDRAVTPEGRAGKADAGDGKKGPSRNRSATPAGLELPEEYRVHKIRDVSSAFKAVGRKFEIPATNDLDYWPFPQPGTTTYAQGRITPGTRITTADERKGCGPNTMYYVEDKHRPQSVLQFSRSVSRDQQKLVGDPQNLPVAGLDYHPNPDALSTKPRRLKGYTDFRRQKGRPPTSPSPGSSVEPLGLYHNSVASVKKVGYVEFAKTKQSQPNFSLYPDDKPQSKPLEVDTSLIERRTGGVIFSKAEKKSVLGENRSETPEYFPSYNQVRRNRPVVSMRGPGREAPVLHEGKPTERANDTGGIDAAAFDRSRHIASPDMSHQISRDNRNKVLEPAKMAADVVYDVPPPKAKAITFSKLTRQ